MTEANVDLDAGLARWVEDVLGRTVASASRTSTGGSRITWLVDLQAPGAPSSVVLRVEGDGSFTGTELSLARETVAYRALAGTAVPVPRVLAVRDDGSAVLLERLAGTDDLNGLSAHDRLAVMDDFARVLATLHRIDPDELDLPGFERPVTVADHARLDLALWARLAARVSHLDPLVAYCGGWLDGHPPTRVARTAFVQGDTGPGNFLARDGRVTGLVDLEFAHVGDPMDDVAWVLMRLRGACSPEQFLEWYARHGGVEIDARSVDYYGLAVDYRCAVTTSLAVDRGGGARGWAPYLLATQRYVDGIASRLAAATGVDVPEIEAPDAGPTARTEMYDRLIETIRHAVRSIEDDDVRAVTRDSQILVHYLRAHDRLGAELDGADRADRTSSCGGPVGDDELVGVAVSAGRQGQTDILTYLLRRHRRQRLLWRSLLDR